jgi:hypothetical protein
MRRSKLMIVMATLGLALGIALALEGWEALGRVRIFLEHQSPRLLGGILVGLSIAVLIRQMRSQSAPPPPRPPGVSQPSGAAPQGDGAVSHPESPPA